MIYKEALYNSVISQKDFRSYLLKGSSNTSYNERFIEKLPQAIIIKSKKDPQPRRCDSLRTGLGIVYIKTIY